MSRAAQLANRYAKALFASVENKEDCLNQMRSFVGIIKNDPSVSDFFTSKTESHLVKRNVLEKSLAGKGMGSQLESFLLLLAERGRFSLLNDILNDYEALVDSLNGVIRGTIKSAVKLDQDARSRIEKVVSHFINKKVILTFSEDPNLVGGVVAQVGGWTFEDTLNSHLTRLKEDLNRRAN